jgi:hypothetical protein
MIAPLLGCVSLQGVPGLAHYETAAAIFVALQYKCCAAKIKGISWRRALFFATTSEWQVSA